MTCSKSTSECLIFILKSLNSRKNIFDLDKVFYIGLNLFDFFHQISLDFNTKHNYSSDELAFVLALKQQMKNNFNHFLDGFVLQNLLLVSSDNFFAFNFHQVVLDSRKIKRKLYFKMIESVKVVRIDFLKKLIEERCLFEMLQVVKSGALSLELSLIVYPVKQKHRVVITAHQYILLIKIIKIKPRFINLAQVFKIYLFSCSFELKFTEVWKFRSELQQSMGSICNPKEPKYIQEGKQQEKNFLRIDDISQLKSISFQFTNQLLIHVKADLLILFMEHTTNMRRNDHFNKLPVQGAKLQEHAKAELVRSANPSGVPSPKFINFNIIIPTLNFNKVSIIFCNIWREEQHNDTQFKDLLRQYFQSLTNIPLKSIAIAEFSSQLGVHLQKGVKRIMREIVKMPNKPQTIEFVCLSEASKAIYMEAVNNHSEDVRRSFNSSVSSQESNYY